MPLRTCCLVVALLFTLVHVRALAQESMPDRVSAFLSSAPTPQAATRADQAASISSRLAELELERLLIEVPASPELADLKFRLAQHAFAYTSARRYLAAMQQALKSLRASGAADESHHTKWYRALVQARAFQEAKAFRTAHANGKMVPLPDRIVDLPNAATGASAWSIDEEGTLRRSPLTLEALTILVVSHPGCGHSRRAADDVQKDPELRALFGAGTQWIAPQDANLDVKAFREWNRLHPTLRMAIVHHADDLPEISTWATPTFYFLRRGKVLEKVVGWPTGGRKEELLVAARRALAAPQASSDADPLGDPASAVRSR